MNPRLKELCELLAKDMETWKVHEEHLKDETIVKLFFRWDYCKEFMRLIKGEIN